MTRLKAFLKAHYELVIGLLIGLLIGVILDKGDIKSVVQALLSLLSCSDLSSLSLATLFVAPVLRSNKQRRETTLCILLSQKIADFVISKLLNLRDNSYSYELFAKNDVFRKERQKDLRNAIEHQAFTMLCVNRRFNDIKRYYTWLVETFQFDVLFKANNIVDATMMQFDHGRRAA